MGVRGRGTPRGDGRKPQLRLDLVGRRLRDRPAALDGVESAEVATVAVGGLDALEAAYARYLPQVVLAVVVPIAVLALAAVIDPVSAAVMLLTLPLVPVFMWLVAATPSGARTSACGRSPGSPRTSSTSCAGSPRSAPLNRGPAQVDQIERVADEYRRATMGTLRIAFLSGTVLELAATLGIALVAVTVGRLVEEASASRPASRCSSSHPSCTSSPGTSRRSTTPAPTASQSRRGSST